MKKETKIFLFRLTILLFISLFACSLTSCKEVKIDNTQVLNFNRNTEPNLEEAYQEYRFYLNNLNNVALEYRLEVERGNIYQHQDYIKYLEKSLDSNAYELQEGVYTQIKILKAIPDNEKPIDSIVKAFPTAYGAGSNATGGRGGEVLHVTNLDWNNNQGSLKWALEEPYTRTIVFDVSGTIKVTSKFYSLSSKQLSNLTIAGQTAPEGGITIEHNWFTLSMDNVIIRYIRFVHVGYFYSNGPVNGTALNFNVGKFGIADHISTRYSWNSVAFQHRRDTGQGTPADGISVQNSIFGDCKTGMLLGPAPNSLDLVNNYSTDFTIYRNLFAHISHRFPNITGNGRFDVINNVAYNPSARLTTVFNNAKVNLIGNYYKDGEKFDLDPNKIATYINVPNPPKMKVFTLNNIVESTNYTKLDTSWDGLFVEWANNSGGQSNSPNENNNRSLNQFKILGNKPLIEDVEDAYNTVINDVGANKFLNADGSFGFYLDEVDESYIKETINRNGVYKNLGNLSELIYPKIPNNQRPSNFYISNSHIPELWFLSNVPTGQGHNDIAPSGYTWLEEYLNRVDNNK